MNHRYRGARSLLAMSMIAVACGCATTTGAPAGPLEVASAVVGGTVNVAGEAAIEVGRAAVNVFDAVTAPPAQPVLPLAPESAMPIPALKQ